MTPPLLGFGGYHCGNCGNCGSSTSPKWDTDDTSQDPTTNPPSDISGELMTFDGYNLSTP